MKILDPTELRDSGLLQEANRRFFHPLGLALAVVQDDTDPPGRYSRLEILDDRADPEGWMYGEVDAAKTTAVAALEAERLPARVAATGFWIQPSAGAPPSPGSSAYALVPVRAPFDGGAWPAEFGSGLGVELCVTYRCGCGGTQVPAAMEASATCTTTGAVHHFRVWVCDRCHATTMEASPSRTVYAGTTAPSLGTVRFVGYAAAAPDATGHP